MGGVKKKKIKLIFFHVVVSTFFFFLGCFFHPFFFFFFFFFFCYREFNCLESDFTDRSCLLLKTSIMNDKTQRDGFTNRSRLFPIGSFMHFRFLWHRGFDSRGTLLFQLLKSESLRHQAWDVASYFRSGFTVSRWALRRWIKLNLSSLVVVIITSRLVLIYIKEHSQT